MKAVEAVRIVMKEKEVGVSTMASRLGKPTRQISERLSQDNISIAKLQELLRVVDYKIAIVPNDTSMKDGWYVIE